MKKTKFYFSTGLLMVLAVTMIFSFSACLKEDGGGVGIGPKIYPAWTDSISYPPTGGYTFTLNGGILMPWEFQKGSNDYGDVIEYGFIITPNQKYDVYYDELPFVNGDEKNGSIGKNYFKLGQHGEFVITVKDKISLKLIEDLKVMPFSQNLSDNGDGSESDAVYAALKEHFKDHDKTKDLYYIAYVISKANIVTGTVNKKLKWYAGIDLGDTFVFSKNLL